MVVRRRERIIGSVCGALIIGGALLFSYVPANLNQVLVQPLIAEPVPLTDATDVGIVLGAGLRRGGMLTDMAEERVSFAVDTHEETGLPLLFTGGATPYGIEAVVMHAEAVRQGYAGPQYIEGSSTSTYENASFSSVILNQIDDDIDEVVLVTSPFHSRRSLETFQQLMPEQKVGIVYPENSVVLNDTVRGRWSGLYIILREYAAILWYKHALGVDSL